jgi:sulfur carrier protein
VPNRADVGCAAREADYPPHQETAVQEIVVNGAPRTVAATTLAALLIELDLATVKVATAVDGEFVPAGARAERVLAPGSRVEIVSPRQGG